MPLPDRAALDRIYTVLRGRRAGLINDRHAFLAIETAIEATGRPLEGGPNIAARLDLVDWLIAQEATFDPPNGAGHVWAHLSSAGLQHAVNVSAEDPAQTLAELKTGRP